MCSFDGSAPIQKCVGQLRTGLLRLNGKRGSNFLLVLLLLFTVKQILLVFIFPPFSGHDEVAHFAYIRTVATEHRIPVIPDLDALQSDLSGKADHGDYLPDDLYQYCQFVLDWDCSLEPRWKQNPPHLVTWKGERYPWGWQYAANHPPLYYLFMSSLYRVTESQSLVFQQYLFRLAAIPFGLLTVLFSFLLARVLFRFEPFVQYTAALFVAFQPQLSYESAMANNDIVGITAVTLVLYLTCRGLRDDYPRRLLVLIGLAIGFGLLAKSTTAIVIPGVAVAIVFKSGLMNVRTWLVRGLLVFGVTGLLVWPWYLFLWRTYGNFSGLDQIAQLQWRWTYVDQTPPTITDQLFSRDFALERWRETWGEFGWRRIHLNASMLIAFSIPCVLGIFGLLIYPWKIFRAKTKPRCQDDQLFRPLPGQRLGLLILFLTCATAYFGVLQFGTRFQLTQARYFFPAIPAAAILVSLGLRAIVPGNALPFAKAAILAYFLVLNVLVYTQFVIPYWYLDS